MESIKNFSVHANLTDPNSVHHQTRMASVSSSNMNSNLELRWELNVHDVASPKDPDRPPRHTATMKTYSSRTSKWKLNGQFPGIASCWLLFNSYQEFRRRYDLFARKSDSPSRRLDGRVPVGPNSPPKRSKVMLLSG